MPASFAAKSELLRYVVEADRLNGNRTADAAFLPDPPYNDPKNHLSVNALELETMDIIADYYRARFQSNRGRVAMAATKVYAFNEAAKKVDVQVSYDRGSSSWKFHSGGEAQDAYKHRPVRGSHKLESESHCGVELVRALTEHTAGKFARRLGGRRFHLL